MNFQKELIRIALIGTQKAELSQEIKQQLYAMGLSKNLSDEEMILSGMSFFSKMKKSHFPLQKIPINYISSATSKNTKKVCSSTSIKHLYMIVDGAFENALPEFLYHLGKNQKRLPPEILPDLLEQSITNNELWKQLKKNIGVRGIWLIHQNPDWHQLLPQQISEDWEDASNDSRLLIFAHHRKENPSQALEMLQETWNTESLNQKIKFLKILEKHLDKDAEPFLETLLDDRRKEVRRTAVQLLAQIESSALSLRIFERIKKLITIKKSSSKKEKLQIQLPDKLEDDMIRDGIDPRIQWFKGGVKASRLGQMVTLLSPQLWNQYFEKNAVEIVEMFVRSEWGELLIQALVEATFLHQNHEWTQALISFKIESQERKRWQSLNISKLMENINDDVFNHVAIQGMKNTKGLLEENSPITLLLKTSACLWQDELSTLVIKNLQEWLASESSRYWNGWHYRTILKKAAYTCNPFLHDQLTADWPEESKIWSSWEREIEEFLSTLYFRKKMIHHLKKS